MKRTKKAFLRGICAALSIVSLSGTFFGCNADRTTNDPQTEQELTETDMPKIVYEPMEQDC